MGLFDMLGVGGGGVKVQLPNRTVQAGGLVEGAVVFSPGERSQQITAVKIVVNCTLTTKKHDPEYGWQEESETNAVVPEAAISGPFATRAGQAQSFPFRFQLPATVPTSIPGQVAYELVASADIDGELDPSESVGLTVAPAAAWAGQGVAVAPPQPGRLRWPDQCRHCGAKLEPPGDGSMFIACAFCNTRYNAESA
jgi:sporulation-control protein spo0M